MEFPPRSAAWNTHRWLDRRCPRHDTHRGPCIVPDLILHSCPTHQSVWVHALRRHMPVYEDDELGLPIRASREWKIAMLFEPGLIPKP